MVFTFLITANLFPYLIQQYQILQLLFVFLLQQLCDLTGVCLVKGQLELLLVEVGPRWQSGSTLTSHL